MRRDERSGITGPVSFVQTYQLLERSRADADETRRLVEEQNRPCLLIQGDVGDSGFCRDAVRRTLDEFGRLGQPDEVAPCDVFLAGDDSSYMTGQGLHPNGGKVVNG